MAGLKVANKHYNSSDVFEWQEFKNLLNFLNIPKEEAEIKKRFTISCAMDYDWYETEYAYKSIIHENKQNKAAWYSKEYKALCKRLGVVDINTSVRETIALVDGRAATVTIEYLAGSK